MSRDGYDAAKLAVVFEAADKLWENPTTLLCNPRTMAIHARGVSERDVSFDQRNVLMAMLRRRVRACGFDRYGALEPWPEVLVISRNDVFTESQEGSSAC